MKVWKIILRIALALVLVASMAGLAWYEYQTITQKERDRQYAFYTEAKQDIIFNLDMAKVAILTKDADLYHESTANVDKALQTISEYQIIREEQAGTVAKVREYNDLLKTKEASLREMAQLEKNVETIKESLQKNYGNAKSISRDALKNSSKKIKELLLTIEDYNEESVTPIAEKINKVLDKMKTSAQKLSDCIDKCYEDEIKKAANTMSNDLGKMVESFPELNKNYIEQFQLEKLDELVKM